LKVGWLLMWKTGRRLPLPGAGSMCATLSRTLRVVRLTYLGLVVLTAFYPSSVYAQSGSTQYPGGGLGEALLEALRGGLAGPISPR